jgi:uncharacterized protein involved in exopolysaccharide biosynthesis
MLWLWRTSRRVAALFAETIDGLREKVRQLQVQLARAEAEQKELTRARDLAWDTYSTLQVKAAELGIAAEMMDVEVRFASSAVEPIEPIESGKVSSNVGLAAVVGLMLGVGVAFLLHYLDPEYDSSAAFGALFRRRKGTN